ncbi:chloride channel protein [Boudabousia tangfeifanii]|uniref:chloride channel protein n=1 Tax=Boudabousia tangfeifanii TaxID=1912795 RepID=UPI001F1CE92C|nr:ClC family H(+)/Cl(-) exchange transporter [Boudabousia tangfeifanii]
MTAIAALVGLFTGIVAATFRICLHLASEFRLFAADWAAEIDFGGFTIYFVVSVISIVLAAALVRYVEPHAEGSGIPRVESVVAGHISPGRSRILPVKFMGGILAIGSGMMLGREGPLVQMGGSVAVTLNKIFHLSKEDLRVLVGAGAAAGLATAFNAPIAGGVFILEELVKKFDIRTSLATLTASSCGFLTSTLLVGDGTDFKIGAIPNPQHLHIPWVVAVGIVCGFIGVIYNNYVMFCLKFMDTLDLPVWIRAGSVAVVIALIGWFAPELVGGGDNLTQEALWGHGTLLFVLGIFFIRFILGPICYAAATPGGLFAPMLVIGTTAGEIVGLVAEQLQPGNPPSVKALAMVGMAAFFAATVRAPVTGLILVTEMTGNPTMLPPMLGACAISMLIATVLKCEPIYDQLSHRYEKSLNLGKFREYVHYIPSAARQVGRGITRKTSSGQKVNRSGARAQQVRKAAQKKERQEDN